MSDPERPYRLGVDIGGTFTDLALLDTRTGFFSRGKTLTTPADPSTAVAAGIADLLKATKVGASEIESVFHATTLATNAIHERRGAPTALITTEGYKDVLDLRDEGRYDLFDLNLEMPEPLVPRSHRFEVRERTLPDGSILESLDVAQVQSIIEALKERGVRAVAISLVHSYKNPNHERAIAVLVETGMPDARVSISSDVAPEIREYPRTSTTVANVYVREVMGRYLGKLSRRIRELGIEGELFIMLSGGGASSPETAELFPVRLIESGPSAGALLASSSGASLGRADLLSFDMGGTTAKSCLIEDGEPHRANECEVARVGRFRKGSGLPIRTPVLELIEIGAGGGSIASVTELGLLKVGPESAGAEPGPACYAKGGGSPTVTDADLALGYINAEYFLGGSMKLDRDAALTTIEAQVARPLGLDVIEAAWGIHRVVNETMASAARMAAVERGRDPSQYPIFAFGGAGPVHAYGVGLILGVKEFVVSVGAGVGSAIGLLCAALSFDFVNSWVGQVDQMNWLDVEKLFSEMESEGLRILKLAAISKKEITIQRTADVRYVGQGYEIAVDVPAGSLLEGASDRLLQSFEGAYSTRYGHVLPGVPIEVVNWRCAVAGPSAKLPRLSVSHPPRHASTGLSPQNAQKGTRNTYFGREGGSFKDTPVYDRYRLPVAAEIEGPAIIEERESTTVVGPGSTATIDDSLSIVVRY